MPAYPFSFSKMHGAGNDFVVTAAVLPRDRAFVRHLCDRRRGIGADGLILLSPASLGTDLAVTFFNCDGSPAEMCGNGLRCAALYAHLRMHAAREQRIATEAGILAAIVMPELDRVRIQIPVLAPPRSVTVAGHSGWFVNTGVPHLVIPCLGQLADLDLAQVAPPLRHHPSFAPAGCNVSFIVPGNCPEDPVAIRTFERGVEAETLACGTGIAAAALALAVAGQVLPPITFVTTTGDLLDVDFPTATTMIPGYVSLTGPATEVFAGTLTITP